MERHRARDAHHPLRRLILLPLLLPLLGGCAGLYFREVAAPPEAPRYTLQAWPYREYWTGIVFNGEKIGLSHLALRPPEGGTGGYELRSEALLAFRFLGLTKHVTLKAQDWVAEDLRLLRFAYDYNLDGQTMRIAGRVEPGRLEVERETGGKVSRDAFDLAEPLYPTSAIALYPALRGLAVGAAYTYLVYDGQQHQVARVTQRITAYQESDLYDGRAYRIETAMDGQATELWLNARGEPVLERAWHGLLFSTLESEQRAKAYLALASVNKRDALVEYSRVRANVALPAPRTVRAMRVVLEGLPPSFRVPSDEWQRCERRGERVACALHRADPAAVAAAARQAGPASEADDSRALAATLAIQSDEPRTRALAWEIVGDQTEPVPRIGRLVDWIRTHIEQEPVDVFSSVDVLNQRKAECQGVTLLYAAFARSLGIPTRVTNGLVYSPELEGFFYHTWAESRVGADWLPVDPTFGQVGVDATHIKLLDGERPADLLPLVDVVGKVRLRIESVEPGP
ncbi:transglutaminase-like domain-containing protein [Nitrospira sp. Kam-Ns4a]